MTLFQHCRLFVSPGGTGDDADVYVHHYDSGQGPQRLGSTGYGTARRDDAVQSGIAELGAQGWELVTVLYTPDVSERLAYYFKRRIDD